MGRVTNSVLFLTDTSLYGEIHHHFIYRAVNVPHKVCALDLCVVGRRAMKIVSTITSCFTSNYVKLWKQFLPGIDLQMAPVFDGRVVEYPTTKILRDYLSWRQADAHINNQVGLRSLIESVPLQQSGCSLSYSSSSFFLNYVVRMCVTNSTIHVTGSL